MKVYQTYYTSCPIGMTGSAGFQFYSVSEGIPENDLGEIRLYGRYTPPMNLPTQPTEQEVSDLFPVSFSYFKLKSGRMGICQSTYIGKDYSGRYGNYFAHCLIFDGELPCHPIQFFNSPVLRKKLTDAELNISETPQKLSTLTLNDMPLNEQMGFEAITGKFDEAISEEVFKDSLNALVDYTQSKRRLIFVGETNEIANYIAALSYSLPLPEAQELTFTTYSFDGANSSLITGIAVEGGRMNYNTPTIRDHQYYVFELLQNTGSTVQFKSEFTERVCLAYAFDSSNLLEYHAFLNQNFKPPFLSTEIDQTLHLYDFHKGVQIDNEQLNTALPFAGEHGETAYVTGLYDFIVKSKVEQTIENAISHTDFIPYFDFFLNYAKNIGDTTTKKQALENYRHFMYAHLEDTVKEGVSAFDIKVFIAFHLAYLDKFQAEGLDAVSVFSDNKWLEEQADYLSEIVPDRKTVERVCANFFMWILETYKYLKVSFLDDTSLKKNLSKISKSIQPEFPLIKQYYSELSKHPEFFASTIVIHKKTNKPKKETFIEYAKEVQGASKEETQKVREVYESEEEHDLLSDSFKNEIDKAKAKGLTFWEIYSNYKSLIKSHPESYVEDILLPYIIRTEWSPREFRKLLSMADEIGNSKVYESTLEHMNSIVLINNLKSEEKEIGELVGKALTIKGKLDIGGVERLETIKVGMDLKNEKTRSVVKAIHDLGYVFDHKQIAGSERTAYFKWYFEYLIKLVKNKNDHERILNFVTSHGFSDEELVEIYANVVAKSWRDKRIESEVLLKLFTHSLDYTNSRKKIGVAIRDTLAKQFAEVREKKMTELEELFLEKNKKNKSLVKEWKNVIESVEKEQSNHSFFKKIKRSIFK